LLAINLSFLSTSAPSQGLPFSVTQLTSFFNPSTTADPRTRGSVRRASGFVQIAVSLTEIEMGIIASEGGMLGKKNIGRVYGASLATIYSTLITGMTYGFSGGLRFGLVLSIFIGLWIAIYFAGVWVAVDRPAELNRKFPFSSKELRRRKKEFYDWLASQGRR